MCDDHVIQSEKHVSQLNEKNECLTSNIQQQTAHCKAMETEQVSSGTFLLDCTNVVAMVTQVTTSSKV